MVEPVARDRAKGGWLESFKPPHLSFVRFLRERLRLRIGQSVFEPLEVVYGASCAYVALQVQKPGAARQVRAVVAQVEHLAGLAGAANITWRVLDEEQLGLAFVFPDGSKSKVVGNTATLGRVFSRCPRAVLERLTPTNNASAQAWRSSCWDRVQAHEAAGRRPLARGDIAVLPESMMFDDGRERESFLITQSEPPMGIAFGGGADLISLGPIGRLLSPAPRADIDASPDGEEVEILTASKAGCVGYLIRTVESRRIIGATNDAATALAVERRWNTAGEAEVGHENQVSMGR